MLRYGLQTADFITSEDDVIHEKLSHCFARPSSKEYLYPIKERVAWHQDAIDILQVRVESLLHEVEESLTVMGTAFPPPQTVEMGSLVVQQSQSSWSMLLGINTYTQLCITKSRDKGIPCVSPTLHLFGKIFRIYKIAAQVSPGRQ